MDELQRRATLLRSLLREGLESREQLEKFSELVEDLLCGPNGDDGVRGLFIILELNTLEKLQWLAREDLPAIIKQVVLRAAKEKEQLQPISDRGGSFLH